MVANVLCGTHDLGSGWFLNIESGSTMERSRQDSVAEGCIWPFYCVHSLFSALSEEREWITRYKMPSMRVADQEDGCDRGDQ